MSRGKGCALPYIPVRYAEDIAHAIIQSIHFSPTENEELLSGIREELESEINYAETDVTRQTNRMKRLKTEGEQILQAYYSELIQPETLKSEQARIAGELKQAESVIHEAKERLDIIHKRRNRALAIAKDLHKGVSFFKANTIFKQHFCKALFTRIVLDNHSVRVHGKLEHTVTPLDIVRTDPINIRQLTQAVLALSLE